MVPQTTLKIIELILVTKRRLIYLLDLGNMKNEN